MNIQRIERDKYNSPDIEKHIDKWLDIVLNRQEDPDKRAEAMYKLGHIQVAKAVEPLIRILKDETEIVYVKEQAIEALLNIGGDEVTNGLNELLECSKGKRLIPAIRVLGEGVLRSTEPKGLRTSLVRGALKNLERIKEWQQEVLEDENRRKILKQKLEDVFYKSIFPILKENPGITIKEMVKKGFDKDLLYDLYDFDYVVIRKKRKGNTRKLFIKEDRNIKENLERKEIHSIPSMPISCESFPESKDLIGRYFGDEMLKSLFKELTRSDGAFDCFLSSVGACVKFEMNDPLEEIVNKYWTPECEDELRKFYQKYGFFSAEAFVANRLEKILGKEKFSNFYAELEEKSYTFEIKWCGFWWDNIGYYHIPWDYVQSLRFKWGIKPEIARKNCLYCGDSFNPFLLPLDKFIFPKILEYYPLEKSISEVNFCSKHFPPLVHASFVLSGNTESVQEKMRKQLKKLNDTIGFIPPERFKEDLLYLKGLDKLKFDEAIKVINDMLPFKKKEGQYYRTLTKNTSQPKYYKDIFGSWNQTLKAVGVIEGEVKKKGQGYVCFAKDGHEFSSAAKMFIDDYFYNHNIPHERKPIYPGSKNLKADWKIGSYFIEFRGLKDEGNYDKEMGEKRDIAKQQGLPLLEITYPDLGMLDLKFNDLK